VTLTEQVLHVGLRHINFDGLLSTTTTSTDKTESAGLCFQLVSFILIELLKTGVPIFIRLQTKTPSMLAGIEKTGIGFQKALLAHEEES